MFKITPLIRCATHWMMVVFWIIGARSSLAYTNPVYNNLADPFICYANDKYYLLGTDGSSTVKVISAATISGLGSGTAANVWNAGGFFESPELAWDGGSQHWYIYYTEYVNGINTVYVIESDTTDPQGTYHSKATLGSTYDATICILNGTIYLVSSTGSHIVIQAMSNFYTLTGSQYILASMDQSWENSFIEAPELVANPQGVVYLFYSSGIYNSQNYREGALKFDGGDPRLASNWTKLSGPIFQGTASDGNYGTATCSPFRCPNGSQYYFVYGGYSSSDYTQPRNTRIQPMSWNSYGSPNLGTPVPLGQEIAEPITESTAFGDFDGDGLTDYALFTPSTGQWNVRSSTPPGNISTFQFGQNGDIPLIGNWSTSFTAETAVFRPSNGNWYVRFQDGTSASLPWGTNGDIPLIGAWSGQMRDEVVFRPSNGAWYIRFGDTGATTTVYWGGGGTNTSDIPLVGNFGGNGMIDQVAYRPSNGGWYVRDGKSGNPLGTFYWGGGPGYTNDIPLIGAWSGQMRDAVIFRPSTATWYIRFGDTGQSTTLQFGQNGDQPMIGNIFGNGMVDQIVFRPSTGMWYVRDGINGAIYSFAFGSNQSSLVHE